MKRIVYIGGGTGSLAVLGGLNKHKDVCLSGIYPITDNGGSTGRLLEGNSNLLPMGDLRQMILAVTRSKFWKSVLDYRFEGNEIDGHSLGNLLLAGLQDGQGIDRIANDLKKVFDFEADLMPVALKRSDLCVKLENGQIIKSETKIDEVIGHDGNLKIIRTWVSPNVKINSGTERMIKEANLIVMGPGDLYTSVAACLVVPGVAKAIRNLRARKVYVCNLMTKFGQTNNFCVQGHAKVIQEILGGNILDYVVYNKQGLRKKSICQSGERLVRFLSNEIMDVSRMQFIGASLIGLIHRKNKVDRLKRSSVRHDPGKLARVLLKLL